MAYVKNFPQDEVVGLADQVETGDGQLAPHGGAARRDLELALQT